MNTSYIHAQNGIVPEPVRPRGAPRTVRNAAGDWVCGVPAEKLPDYDWYPLVREELPPYVHSWIKPPVVTVDAQGARIALYRADVPDAATLLDRAKAALLRGLRGACSDRIETHWEPHEQRNVSLGLYPPETCDRCRADIESMVTEYRRAKADLNEAADIAAAEAVVAAVDWPLPEEA